MRDYNVGVSSHNDLKHLKVFFLI